MLLLRYLAVPVQNVAITMTPTPITTSAIDWNVRS